jgi:hypothetical protein
MLPYNNCAHGRWLPARAIIAVVLPDERAGNAAVRFDGYFYNHDQGGNLG